MQRNEDDSMNTVSDEIRRRIFELWLQGVSRDEIARRVNVSGSTVSAVVASWPASLMHLRDLAKVLKKLNCDPKDALEGVIIRNALFARGLDSKNMLRLIEGYDRISSATGFQVKELYEAVVRLAKLELEAGKHYKKALVDFERANRENVEAESKNADLLSEIKKNEEVLVKTYELAKVAPQDIADYQRLKLEFEKKEMNLLDIGDVNTYVVNMRESGNNPQQFIEMCKNHQVLKKSHDKMQRRHSRVQTALAKIEQLFLSKRLELTLAESRVAQLRSQEQALRFTLDAEYSQYCRLQSDIYQLYLYRKELIAQIGRVLGMSETEIIGLQAEAQLELIMQIIERRHLETIKKLQEQLKVNL